MAELAGDVGDVEALGDEQAGERVAEVVEADVREPGGLDGGGERSAADVSVHHRSADLGTEDEGVVASKGRWAGKAMCSQGAREGGHEGDIASCLWRLGFAQRSGSVELTVDVDRGAVEVDVLPLQAEQLALSEAGENRGREQHAVMLNACGLEQLRDLVGVEHAHLAALDSRSFVALELTDRVAGAQPTARRVGERPRERLQRRHDRGRRLPVRSHASNHLRYVVNVHIGNATTADPGNDVHPKAGLVSLPGPRSQVRLRGKPKLGDIANSGSGASTFRARLDRPRESASAWELARAPANG